jgi:hypothetical protein
VGSGKYGRSIPAEQESALYSYITISTGSSMNYYRLPGK